MNPDIQPHELADMRRAADKAPHGVQQKFHVLLDGYEDHEKASIDLETLKEDHEKLQKSAADTVVTLRGVYPKESAQQWKPPEEPPSEDAWAECLADCLTPEETAATKDEELKRARAAEVKLRARIEALEEAVESALEELE